MASPDDLAALSPLARPDPDDLAVRIDLQQAADPLARDDNLGIPLPELPPARLPNAFDPEGREPRQGMSFRENVAGSFRSNTIEGAIVEKMERDAMRARANPAPRSPLSSAIDKAWIDAATADPTMIGAVNPTDPWSKEVPPEEAIAARAALDEQSFFNQLAYDINPTRVTPSSVFGTLLGAVTPTNMLTAGRALSVAGLGARPVARAAVDSAIMAGLTDAATQGIRTQSGAQEEFDTTRAALAPVVGGAAGGALAAAGPVVAAGARRLGGAVADTIRDMRGLDPALVRPPAELPRAPASEASEGVPVPGPAGSVDDVAEAPAAEGSKKLIGLRPNWTWRPKGMLKSLSEVIDWSLQRKQAKVVADLGPVENPRVLEEGAKLGYDLTGYRHTVDNFGIIHAMNQHGGGRETLRGQLPLTKDDFDLIPQIVSNPDYVDNDGGRTNDVGRGVIRYWKTLDDTVFYVEEVRTKRGELAMNSMFKWKKGAGGFPRPDVAKGPPDPTSETAWSTPASENVAQPTPRIEPAPIGEPVPHMPPHKVSTSDGASVDVRPVIVEARDLRTSSDAGYDASLQPRQRDRAASQEQIRSIASDLQPERLGFSSEADRGAPIVGPDGMVESGNGRIEAIRRAYEEGGEPALRYREWLRSMGADVDNYDAPVLVRERMTEMTPEERQAFGIAANRPATLALSAAEQALADARAITTEALDLIRNANDLGAIANRDFVRAFAGALPQTERGALTTAEGGLSSGGLTRVKNAVLAKAYGNAPVLSRVTEATSDDIKSISNALVAAAPDWAKLRADLDAGRVRADIDLLPELLEAVTRTADLRARGTKLDAFLTQQDAFERVSPSVEEFMRMFYDPSGRKAAGGPRIAEALRTYATEARKVSADPGLDLGLPAVSARDIQRVAAQRGRGSPDEPEAVLFRRGARDGADDAARGQEVRRPSPGEPRADAGGAGGAVDGGRAGRARAAELAEVESHVRSEAKAIGDELFATAVGSPHGNQIEKGRPLVDQGTAVGDTRVGRLEEMAQRFAAGFENVLRTGRVKAGALGQYNIKTGVSRVRTLSDLDTVIHEVGHSLHLDPSKQATFDKLVAVNSTELAPVGAGQSEVGDREAFAELFRLFVTNRAYAERTYPQATRDLNAVLADAFPEQLAAIDDMRAGLDALHRADSGSLVTADVITPAPDGLFSRIMNVFGLRDVGARDVDPLGRPLYQWRDALYTRFIDPKNPVARAIEALGRVYRDNTGKTLDLLPADDAYIRARLSSGANAVADSILKKGVIPADGVDAIGPSFFNAITTAIGGRWTQQQWQEFGAYLVSRRMVAEYDRFLAGEIPNPPGKFSQADYARAVKEFDEANPTFAKGAAQLYEFQRNYLQRTYDKHLFSKTYFDVAMAREDYVPLHRDMADLGAGQTVNMRSGDVRTSLMKSFRGSQRSVLNPLDMIFKRVHDFEFEIASNDTKRALAKVAEMAGPGSGAIAEPIPANKLTATHIDVLDALKKAGQKANVDDTDLGALMHQAEGLLGDDVFAKVFRQEPIRPGQEPITFYFEGGERRALRLADSRFGTELYQALNGMSPVEQTVFVSALQLSQAILRAGVTKSLGFIYRNFVRDQLTSTATAGRSFIPFYSALKGGFDIMVGGGDFERYIAHGGIAGGLINDAIENSAFGRNAQAFRERSMPGRTLHGMVKAIEFSEASTRAGLFQSYYKQAQGLGFDDLNAVLYATFKSNDYIDFRKAGSHMAAIRRFVPFLNAAVQGTDREYRALFGDMIRLEGKRFRGEELSTLEQDALKDARIAWLKVLALGSIVGGGTAYLNAENPEWSQAASWRRNSAYHLVPIGDGRWIVAPKPFGFVRNVSDLFEYATEYAIRKDPSLVGKWLKSTAEAHHLPYSNPLIDVWYNTRSNYDAFRDKPIVPTYLQGVEPSQQYDSRTSEVAKWIGDVTGWSPMKVQYVARALGGGIAQDFIFATDALLREKGTTSTIWDMPLMRELAKNVAPGNEITKAFWDQVRLRTGSLSQAADTYKAKINAGERVGAVEYLKGLTDDRKAWAVLMTHGFTADEKMAHPLYAAEAHATVISGITRQLVNNNLIKESEVERGRTTLSRRDAKPIPVDGPVREKVLSELGSLQAAYARNALLATKAPGLGGIQPVDPAVQLDRIKALSPEVYDELLARTKQKRIPDLDRVRDAWPAVRERLLKDGENADLSGIAAKRPRRSRN